MPGRVLSKILGLGLVVVVLAGVLVVLPTAGSSDSVIPTTSVSRTSLADGSTVDDGWSTTVNGEANLVGLRWKGDRSAEFEVDRRGADGSWKRVETTGQTDVLPDPGSPDARSAERKNGSSHSSEPVWLGDANEVRIRLVSGTASGVQLDRVRAPRPRVPSAAAGAAVPAQPGIVSRARWGADEGLRLGNCPNGPDYDARVQLAIVHHTDNSNDYSPAEAPQLVRSVYAYHTVSLGYCDIAYDFLIDRFGTVYEGRYGGIAEPVHGAHSVGYNTNTTGIALIGNYSTGAPTGPQLNALNSLIAWKLAIHNVYAGGSTAYTTISGNDVYPPGTTRVLPTVIGHRDTWSTDCPGQNMYSLLPAVAAGAAAIQRAVPPSAWRSWEPLGGGLNSAPASASWQPGRLDTFVQGTDNQMWHRWFDRGWSGWEPLGGALTAAPSVVAWGPNRLDAFVRGSDNALWHKWYDGVRWSGWESLGGNLTSAPTVASWTEGRLDVFVRDAGGQVAHRAFAGGWSAWEPLGGSITGAPAVVSWALGRIDLFARGPGNDLVHRFFQGGWSGWESLGGVLAAEPTASSWAEGRLDVFVRGSDNQMWHTSYQQGWVGWDGLGGGLTSGPGAVSWEPTRIDVFVRGTDNQMWHRWYG
jgi:hypothetical protein